MNLMALVGNDEWTSECQNMLLESDALHWKKKVRKGVENPHMNHVPLGFNYKLFIHSYIFYLFIR